MTEQTQAAGVEYSEAFIGERGDGRAARVLRRCASSRASCCAPRTITTSTRSPTS